MGKLRSFERSADMSGAKQTQMKILLAGATGQIGRKLAPRLLENNHELVILTRNTQNATKSFAAYADKIEFCDYKSGWQGDRIDAVINLAGSPIIRPWTKEQKRRVLNSRILSNDYIYIRCQQNKTRPSVWITTSAMGYYGDCGDEILTEESKKESSGSFLQEVCTQVENNSKKIESAVDRHIVVRMGTVIEAEKGFLSAMSKLHRWHVGGRIGNGQQYLPWIHIDDAVAGIIHLVETAECRGTYNLCSPNPCRQEEMNMTLSQVLDKINPLTIPRFAIKIVYGSRSELVLSSQRGSPERLIKTGFIFKHPDLLDAISCELKPKNAD